jgi:predicted CopG family antitoxin
MATTTIAVSTETKEMLRRLSEKGESYEELLRRLIKEVGWKRLDTHWNQILEDDDFIPLDKL